MSSARYRRIAAALTFAFASAALAAPPPATLVFCAPGSPGTTEEAQGAMDAFAAAAAARAGLPAGALAATYAATEEAGVARLKAKDATVAFVSVPFFLKHEKSLALRAELQAVMQEGASMERWSLVAKKGRVSSPAALDGFTVMSSAGFAPAFVRGTVLGSWGKLPASLKIVQSATVLSALRCAAAGEPVAVLLDGAQGAALPGLPFAADLEVVARSPELPVGLVAVVDRRLPAPRWEKLSAALRGLADDRAGGEALAGIRMTRFVPLDAKALADARKAYAEGAR